jgi:hypothetical protein
VEGLELTVEWHQAEARGKDMRAVSLRQIERYVERIAASGEGFQ